MWSLLTLFCCILAPKGTEKPEASGDAPKETSEEKEGEAKETEEGEKDNGEKKTNGEMHTVSQLREWLNEKVG